MPTGEANGKKSRSNHALNSPVAPHTHRPTRDTGSRDGASSPVADAKAPLKYPCRYSG
jgi:hypothetical protein